MDTNFPAIREAIAADVENITLRVHLCDLLVEQGDLDEALAEIRSGLAIAPDDVALLGLAARITGRLGHWQLARRYERVLDAVIQAPPAPRNPPVTRSGRAEPFVGFGQPQPSTGSANGSPVPEVPPPTNGSVHQDPAVTEPIAGSTVEGMVGSAAAAAAPSVAPVPIVHHNRRRDDPKPDETHNRRRTDPKPIDEADLNPGDAVPVASGDDRDDGARSEPAFSAPAEHHSAEASEPMRVSRVVHDLREPTLVNEAPTDVADHETAAAVPAPGARADEQDGAWEAPVATGRRLIEVSRPTITLDAVAGMTDLVDDLRSFCEVPVRSPERHRESLLLWGPAGCGKAFLAEACAGSLQARFVHVHLPDAVDLWLSKDAHEIASIFADAIGNAPCVLFLDGLDALSGHQELLTTALGEFVMRLDRLAAANTDITVVASTERPWLLNRNLLTPGRFGTHLFVPPPDRPAREAIVLGRLAERSVGVVDAADIARDTPAYTAADLVFVCELATEYAIFESIDAGQIRPIGMDDLERAVKEARPSAGDWFRTAREHASRPGRSDLINYDHFQRWLDRAHLN